MHFYTRFIRESPWGRGAKISSMYTVGRNALAICERPVLSFRKLRGRTQEPRIRALERPGESSSQRWIRSPSSYAAHPIVDRPRRPFKESDYALKIENRGLEIRIRSIETERNGLKLKFSRWSSSHLQPAILNLQCVVIWVWYGFHALHIFCLSSTHLPADPEKAKRDNWIAVTVNRITLNERERER